MILGVNIDHVATIRQARKGIEPDPVMAAALAILGGADGITVHLREDRRHIQDRDLKILKEFVPVELNLEMAATKEIIGIATHLKPDLVTLVPEKRQELTTEGGLGVKSQKRSISEAIKKIHNCRNSCEPIYKSRYRRYQHIKTIRRRYGRDTYRNVCQY